MQPLKILFYFKSTNKTKFQHCECLNEAQLTNTFNLNLWRIMN